MRRCFVLALAFVLVGSILATAQQLGTEDKKDDRCDSLKWDLAACAEMNRELDAKMRDEIKKDQEKIEAIKERAEEAKRAYDNLKKIQSGDPDQQREGIIDGAKTINSRREGDGAGPGDATPASVAVTDKALSFIGEATRIENQSLNNFGNAVQASLAPPPEAKSSSFNAREPHQLNVLERQTEQVEQRLLSSPLIVQTVHNADLAWDARVEAARKQEKEERWNAAVEDARRRTAEREAEDARRKKLDEDLAAIDAENDREIRKQQREFQRRQYQMQQMYSGPSLYAPMVPQYPAPAYGGGSYGGAAYSPSYGAYGSAASSGSNSSTNAPTTDTSCPNIRTTGDMINAFWRSPCYGGPSVSPSAAASSQSPSDTTQTTTTGGAIQTAGSVVH